MKWDKPVIYGFRLPLRFRPASFLVGALLMLGPILISISANAWWKDAHWRISENTLEVIPTPLKEALSQHYSALLSGSVEPDYNRVDDHKIYLNSVSGWGSPGMSGAHFALERFALQAESMLRAGKPMDEIAFVLGQAAHFIEDLNVPLHTVWGETQDQHYAYESVAHFNWQAEKHYYPGFYLIKNYRCYAFEIAKRSNRYAGLSLLNPPPPSVIEITWLDAINDLANLWQSIFYRALGPEKAKDLYGIPTPKGEKGDGWFCR